jgi:hypothetical protein
MKRFLAQIGLFRLGREKPHREGAKGREEPENLAFLASLRFNVPFDPVEPQIGFAQLAWNLTKHVIPTPNAVRGRNLFLTCGEEIPRPSASE